MFETNMELAHDIINHIKLRESAIILDCVEFGSGTFFRLKTETQVLRVEVSVQNLNESEVLTDE